MNWKYRVQHWRSLPAAEKHAIRWRRIPQSMAASMAFEQEPVSLSMLQTEHARRPMPRDTSISSSAAQLERIRISPASVLYADVPTQPQFPASVPAR